MVALLRPGAHATQYAVSEAAVVSIEVAARNPFHAT